MVSFLARAFLWFIFAVILFDIIKEVNRIFDLSLNPYLAIVPSVLNYFFQEYMIKKWKINPEAQSSESTKSRIDKTLFMVGWIIIGSLILCVFAVWALLIYNQTVSQDKFTVSGQVKFPESTGPIHVWLKTRDEFEKWGEPSTPARSLMIKPTAQELEVKKVTFKFVDVPKRFYCIIGIQDLNKNEKMDFTDTSSGESRAAEPYGCSGSNLLGSCQWSDIKFEVDKDISGIEIELR